MQEGMMIGARMLRQPISNAWSDTRLLVFARANQNFSVGEASLANAAAMTYRGRSSGKYYAEIQASATGTFNCAVGIRRSDEAIGTAVNAGQTCAMRSTNTVWAGSTGATTGTGMTFSSGSRVMLAIELVIGGTNKLWIGVNGTWANSGNPAAGTNPLFSGFPTGEWHWYVWTDNDTGGHEMTLANGQTDVLTFNHTVPDGFQRGMRY